MSLNIPFFTSDNAILNKAARIAAGDIAGNCIPFKDGLLQEAEVCIMAGMEYDTPWTRDAAINTMNAMAIMDPDVAYNTLLSVCEERDGKNYIGGQYWDAIIWAIGAWQYYLVTLSEEFLDFAITTIENSIEYFEATEFDPEDGLFRGAAVYGDGIAAYPDKYANMKGHLPAIFNWPDVNPEKKVQQGYGLPIKALSTNCVYYAAYVVLSKMLERKKRDTEKWLSKAQRLKDTINRNFWNPTTGRYDYLFDGEIRCESEEALGLAFAVLFGIADEEKCKSIAEYTSVTDHGIACVWPSFQRYRIGNHYGRHSGTIWPHAQGYWALAMLRSGFAQAFEKEYYSLTYKAVRDMQFAEIYHPVTGEIYGGLQEEMTEGFLLSKSREKQTWSATAYWAMIYYGVFGLNFTPDVVEVKPYLPIGVDHAELQNLKIGDAVITIKVDRYSTAPRTIEIPRNLQGRHTFQLGCI